MIGQHVIIAAPIQRTRETIAQVEKSHGTIRAGIHPRPQ